MTLSEIEPRPKFLSLLLEEMKADYEARGLIALTPFWFMLFVGGGIVVAFRLPGSFWSEANQGTAATVFGAVLTFNGLLLALSWSAFSRIHEVICQPDFSEYLRTKGLLKRYIFFIDWIHSAQVAAAVVTSGALIAIFSDEFLLETQRVFLGCTLGITAYALKQGGGAVSLMHDVIWYHAIFEGQQRSQQGGNVTSLGRNR